VPLHPSPTPACVDCVTLRTRVDAAVDSIFTCVGSGDVIGRMMAVIGFRAEQKKVEIWFKM